MRREVILVVVAAAVLVVGAWGAAVGGGGWATTHPLAGGSVALTNSQANTVWAPVAVLWSFASGTNAVLTVTRVSQGYSFRLGTLSVTNATTAAWVPEAELPFEFGDVLTLMSTATNGAVQVIRK